MTDIFGYPAEYLDAEEKAARNQALEAVTRLAAADAEALRTVAAAIGRCNDACCGCTWANGLAEAMLEASP
jgi:hypothetical protein